MMLRAVLILAAIAVAAYGLFEIRSWNAPDRQSSVTPRQRVIRTWGLVLLLASLALWYRGTYFQPPAIVSHHATRASREAALKYIGYWTLTFIVMVPLVPLALLDTREGLRQAAEERRKALNDIFTPSSSPDEP